MEIEHASEPASLVPLRTEENFTTALLRLHDRYTWQIITNPIPEQRRRKYELLVKKENIYYMYIKKKRKEIDKKKNTGFETKFEKQFMCIYLDVY